LLKKIIHLSLIICYLSIGVNINFSSNKNGEKTLNNPDPLFPQVELLRR
jgi:hypothetical protein